MKASEFGKYIKQLRSARNLTIRQLQLYSGVSNSYLSQLENGKRGIPSPEILKKLSKGLKLPYEELMKEAGYLEDDKTDNISEENKKSAEEIYDDPNFQHAMRSAQGFSKENKKRVLEYIEMIEEIERGRKPGDRQPRPRKR